MRNAAAGRRGSSSEEGGGKRARTCGGYHARREDAERERVTGVLAETPDVLPQLRHAEHRDQRGDVDDRHELAEKPAEQRLLLGKPKLVAAQRADARFYAARAHRNQHQPGHGRPPAWATRRASLVRFAVVPNNRRNRCGWWGGGGRGLCLGGVVDGRHMKSGAADFQIYDSTIFIF